MGLPLPQCFWLRGTKLRPWSKQNSDQNSDHTRLCIYQGMEKLRPWSKFLGRENPDHGLNFGTPRGGGRSGSDCRFVSPLQWPPPHQYGTIRTITQLHRSTCSEVSVLYEGQPQSCGRATANRPCDLAREAETVDITGLLESPHHPKYSPEDQDFHFLVQDPRTGKPNALSISTPSWKAFEGFLKAFWRGFEGFSGVP